MRWAGRFARFQAQPRSHSIYYSCNASFTTLLLPTRSSPIVTRRAISTDDEGEACQLKSKETLLGITEVSHNGPIVSLKVSIPSHRLVNFRFNKVNHLSLPKDESANQSLHGLKEHPFERIKTTRPPVKRVLFRNLEEDLSGIKSANSENKKHAKDLFRIMAETNSPSLIWQAYQRAVSLSFPIPSILLDRISRVLVRNYAPTRNTFLRLHEVLQHLRDQGHIKRWQWNSLIYHSALGMRKIHTKDYQAALDVFREMQYFQSTPGNKEHCKPNIYTYTTLLSIAIRTGVPENVEHAYSLLRDSKLQQDRIARLSIIPYYIRNRNLKAVRAIVKTFGEAHEDIGIDGINAYMWAFGRHGMLEEVEEIYQALRSNLVSVDDPSSQDVPSDIVTEAQPTLSLIKSRLPSRDDPFLTDWHSSINDVQDLVFEFTASGASHNTTKRQPSTHSHTETDRHSEQSHRFLRGPKQQVNGDLLISAHHIPNNVTYTLCIQAYAYHRDLPRALQIFRDLITTPNKEKPWEETTQTYRAFHKAYRALFLGLARQSHLLYTASGLISDDDHMEDARQWTVETLEFLFQSFLTMEEEETRPNDRTVGWIMQAFAKCSNHDPEKLIWVWRSMEQRFGPLRVPHLYRSLVSRSLEQEPNNEL